MRRTRLVRELEDLLDRAWQHAELHGDADSLLRHHDPEFPDQLERILDRIAGRGPRRREQKDKMSALKDKNRTLQSLSSSSVPELKEEVIATIWGWAKDEKSFFTPGSKTDTSSPILDSVCKLLIHNTTAAVQINTIHTRLLLYFLARFVDETLEDVRDMDQVVKLLVESGWISDEKELIALFKTNFPKWHKAGKGYIRLVELVGDGPGTLIYFPLISPSTWESHCPREGTYAQRIKDRLQELGVPAAASIERDGLTGHQVVQKLMEHLFTQSSISFVRCDPTTESRPTENVRWLRRHRDSHPSRQSSQGPFSGDYSSDSPSPTVTPRRRLSEYCQVFSAAAHVDPRLLHSQYSRAVG